MESSIVPSGTTDIIMGAVVVHKKNDVLIILTSSIL